jgi:cell division protein FtsQ
VNSAPPEPPADDGAHGPPARVLEELDAAFADAPETPVGEGEPPPPPRPSSEPGDVAPSIIAESLVPESTRRSRRRSRREARREAKQAAKRAAKLEKEQRKARKKSRRQQDVDVESLTTLDNGESVRIIPGDPGAAPSEAPATAAPATPSAPAPSAPTSSRATIAIDDDGLPDAVYLEGDLGAGGSATVIPPAASAGAPAAGADRATVFIDDRGTGTGEIVAIDVATSAARMEPRMRERRIAVKRAAGRKRLRWVAVAAVAVLLVVGTLVALGSSLFDIDRVDVEGAVYSAGPDLDAAVAELDGHNVLLADTDAVERMVEAIPWVESARVTTDFPHAAKIEIRERRPVVAYLAADNRYRVLDRRGRVLDVLDGRPVEYLELIVDDGPTLEPGQLAPLGFRAAATLVSALTPQMRQRASSVSIDRDALELTMTIDGGIEVRFGAPEDLQDKLVRLQTALTDPNLELTATELIDVSTEDMNIR